VNRFTDFSRQRSPDRKYVTHFGDTGREELAITEKNKK
jgi:hypothetical protein